MQSQDTADSKQQSWLDLTKLALRSYTTLRVIAYASAYYCNETKIIFWFGRIKSFQHDGVNLYEVLPKSIT